MEKVKFGILSQEIMRRKDITIEAKSIYAYLVSFAGNKNYSYPTVSTICDELCISEARFRTHLDYLTSLGIIKPERIRENNRFGRNIYFILDKLHNTDEFNG